MCNSLIDLASIKLISILEDYINVRKIASTLHLAYAGRIVIDFKFIAFIHGSAV
jgi:hypothetical protein